MDADVAALMDEYIRSRGDRLVRTAYLLTGDRQICDDLVQTTLASVLVSWRRIRDVSDLDAYVYTALVNARARWWRRRSRVEQATESVPEQPAVDENGRYDGREEMVAALRTLPPRQRAVLVLRFYEDLTEAQTATILGCSVGTVKSQAARGLQKLRRALDPGPGPRPAELAQARWPVEQIR